MILYIFSLETPIRYAISEVSKQQDIELIKDIGPFAFALHTILSCANSNLSTFKKDQITVNYIGCQLTDAQIKDYQEMLEDHVNLKGFRACNASRSEAWKESFQNMAKGKTSTIISVVCSTQNDWLVVDKPEYSPYSETETSVIIQDG